MTIKITLSEDATRLVECGDEVPLGVISYNVRNETLSYDLRNGKGSDAHSYPLHEGQQKGSNEHSKPLEMDKPTKNK